MQAGGGYGPVVWAPDERAVEVSVDDATMFVAELRGRLRLIRRVRSREDMSPAWSPTAVTSRSSLARRALHGSAGSL
jgi:hypothetical protein